MEPAEHLRFGKQLAAFIDPSLDASLASVSLPLSSELGGRIVGAAKVHRSLPTPVKR